MRIIEELVNCDIEGEETEMRDLVAELMTLHESEIMGAGLAGDEIGSREEKGLESPCARKILYD